MVGDGLGTATAVVPYAMPPVSRVAGSWPQAAGRAPLPLGVSWRGPRRSWWVAGGEEQPGRGLGEPPDAAPLHARHLAEHAAHRPRSHPRRSNVRRGEGAGEVWSCMGLSQRSAGPGAATCPVPALSTAKPPQLPRPRQKATPAPWTRPEDRIL